MFCTLHNIEYFFFLYRSNRLFIISIKRTELNKKHLFYRDNMRMLKPNTPGGRMNQTFIMSSKSPSFASKG